MFMARVHMRTKTIILRLWKCARVSKKRVSVHMRAEGGARRHAHTSSRLGRGGEGIFIGFSLHVYIFQNKTYLLPQKSTQKHARTHARATRTGMRAHTHTRACPHAPTHTHKKRIKISANFSKKGPPVSWGRVCGNLLQKRLSEASFLARPNEL